MISFFKPTFKSVDEIIQMDEFKSQENQELFKKVFHKDHFFNPLNQGNNTSYRKFIVISTQRSGTNLLVNLLRSHSNVVCYTEIFKENNRPLWCFQKTDSKTYQLAQKYPVDYLNHYFFRNYSENVKAVGFKYMYNQLRTQKIKKVIQNFHKEQDLIIHLKRKNKLRAYLSLKLMEESKISAKLISENELGKFQNKKPSGIENFKPVYIKSDELKTYIETTYIAEKQHSELIKNQNHITVFYENLLKEMVKTANQIIINLGLPIEELTILNEKQNKYLLSESILNYAELKKEFAETEFASFFEE
ncbi:MAG TPA: Stf0 family sulfotransferase [Bacteroidales bacterium]|nr:Stf0 family sulfotransferase [Bacteroidales bacterium]